MASNDDTGDVRKALENRDKSQAGRIRRTIELRAHGYSYPKIHGAMRLEGYKTSEMTIRRDLQTDEAHAFRDELLRRQLEDITVAEDVEVRLKWRAHILDKLFPSISYAGRISQEIEEESVRQEDAGLRDFTEEEQAEIRRTGRLLLSKRPSPTGPTGL
jgi:hypothetical protein